MKVDTSREAVEATSHQHKDDAAVDRFAEAMKAKLKDARENKGRRGWDDEAACSEEFLAASLLRHTYKSNAGTFEDIANFAMMLHQRGVDVSVLKSANEDFDKELRDAAYAAGFEEALEEAAEHILTTQIGQEGDSDMWVLWNNNGVKASAAAIRALSPQPLQADILEMKLSGGRLEHWVRIKCGDRTFDVRNYPGEYYNRALYERDYLRHVLFGEPKPDLMADEYADPPEPTQSPQTPVTPEQAAQIRKDALEEAAALFDEEALHDWGGVEYSEAVGIPISNRGDLIKSAKRAEENAQMIRAIAGGGHE